MKNFKNILIYFNLKPEIEDFDVIHTSIEKEIVFRGMNLWILTFAIIIASIGLNINSTAVIIGAMLISPLMGPINAIGYSIATYNFPLLRRALKNYAFAVIASISTSTVYFMITPLLAEHSELLARTSPTIYDVLIAMFGGLSGIVALCSKRKGNVMPGVAIATALMPPLCTAGYGLATLQFEYFLGAFYLFTINSVLIALSALFISRLLKLPIRALISDKKKKAVKRYIGLIIVITIFPSIYLGYKLVKKERFEEFSKKYIESVRIFEDNYLLENKLDTKNNRILLIYGGKDITENQQNRIKNRATNFNINPDNVFIKQGFKFEDNSGKWENAKNEIKSELSYIYKEMSRQRTIKDSLDEIKEKGGLLLNEIQTIFPQIKSCSYSETQMYKSKITSNDSINIPIIIVIFEAQKDSINVDNKMKIENWTKRRLKKDNINIYYKEINTQ